MAPYGGLSLVLFYLRELIEITEIVEEIRELGLGS